MADTATSPATLTVWQTIGVAAITFILGARLRRTPPLWQRDDFYDLFDDD